MNEILDQPEKRKRFSGKWMSLKFFGYGFAIFFSIQLLGRGIAWALVTQNWLSEGFIKVFQLFAFFGGLAFLFCNLLGIVTAFTYLTGGKDSSETIAGLIGLLINLIPIGLFIAFAT